MKRVVQIALSAIIIMFAACSKEEIVPPHLIQELEHSNLICVDPKSYVDETDNVSDDYITLEEARKALESILSDFATLSKSSNTIFPSRKIADGFTLKSVHNSLSKSTTDTDTAKIHIFNFDEGSGFAIMSATRAMPSLIAITEDGNIDTNQVIDNPGLIIFLSNLETACALAKQRWVDKNKDFCTDDDITISTSSTTLTKRVSLDTTKFKSVYSYRIFNPVGGYCKVHWGQMSPYNLYCYTEDGERAYVGCVAVACAQLMSIYEHPKKYKGRSLNWSEMLTNIYSDDLAWFMKKLGDSTNIDILYGSIYDTIGSSGKYANIPRTFKNFGYSNGGSCIDYNENAVCNELKNHYPVLLAGYSKFTIETTKNESIFGIKCSTTSYSKGHQWLAHGLLERTETEYKYVDDKDPLTKKLVVVNARQVSVQNYILCNFGWGEGKSLNGYYLSGVFDTNKGGVFPEDKTIRKSWTPYYYQYETSAVVNIRK